MTDIEALITLTRRYCLDNFSFWADKYSKESSGNNNPYSDKDYDIFPRYNVLTAIRQGIELFVGQHFETLEACKATLKEIGFTSQNIFTTGKQNKIAANAIQDERNKFIAFIGKVTIEELQNVEALPYRRRLKTDEAKSIRKQLKKIWGYDHYWEPIEHASPKETVFLMKANIISSDYDKIIDIVKEKSDAKIFEISEDHIDYEIEIDSFDPDCYETIFTDKTYNWVIYGSHESTLAFGGTWLVTFMKQLFADRENKLNKWE